MDRMRTLIMGVILRRFKRKRNTLCELPECCANRTRCQPENGAFAFQENLCVLHRKFPFWRGALLKWLFFASGRPREIIEFCRIEIRGLAYAAWSRSLSQGVHECASLS